MIIIYLFAAQFSHLGNDDRETYLDSSCIEWQSVSPIIAYTSTQHVVGVATDNGAAVSDDSDGGGHHGAGGLVAMGLFLPIQYFEVRDSSL